MIAEAKQQEADAANGANNDGHDDLPVHENEHQGDAAFGANNDGDDDIPVHENDDDVAVDDEDVPDVPIFEEAEEIYIVYGQ